LGAHLSLKDAIKRKRLGDFIAQEEKRGIGPAEIRVLESTIVRLLKERPAADQTSRSAKRGGSRGHDGRRTYG